MVQKENYCRNEKRKIIFENELVGLKINICMQTESRYFEPRDKRKIAIN